MSTRRSIVVLTMFTALGTAAACSSGDPYDLRPGSSVPDGTGWVNPNGGYDAAASFDPVWPEAGSVDDGGRDAGWAKEGGAGSVAETGTTPVDSGAPSTPLGSCSNPICGGDGIGDCGCYATDSQGNSVTIGCSGDDCACFVNQQQMDDNVQATGSCDSNSATAETFILDCACN